MNRSPLSPLIGLVVAFVLVVTACGSDDDGDQIAASNQTNTGLEAEPSPSPPTTELGAAVEASEQDDGGEDEGHGHADGGEDEGHGHADGGEDEGHGHADGGEDEGHGDDDGGEDEGHGHDDGGEDEGHGHADGGEDEGRGHDDGGEDEGHASEDRACDGCVAPEVLAAAEAMVEAYNDGDWEAFTAILGTTEPTWETGIGVASTDHIRADFDWAFAMNQQMMLDGCVEDFGFLTCIVVIEDDVHRAVVDFGLEPSRCRMVFELQEGPILAPARYDLTTCFAGYDQAFHAFGDWFESTYPGEEPIQGFHYRAWNQFGEGAPERAAAVLDEWLAQIPEQG